MAMVLLTGLSGCADFEQALTAFCQRNPQRCGHQDPVPVAPPTIVQSSQSATRVLASDTVTFSVTAEEATSQLEFAWTSTSGTLGVPSTTGTNSQVTWTPPLCSPANSVVTVSVTVTNRGGLSTSKVFTLSTNPCPAPMLSTARRHSLALHGDGTVWAWGDNQRGALGDGTTTDRAHPVQVSGLNSVTAIAIGENHSLALRSDGTVWAWGDNYYGQLGDGTINQRLTPVQVSGLTGVTAIATGDASSKVYSFALRSDGTVWSWGSNHHGQLGDGTIYQRLAPVQVSGLTGVTAIATSSSFFSGHRFESEAYALALRNDGTVWAWGDNQYGQLGDGTTIQRFAPVQVSGLTGITHIVTSQASEYSYAAYGAYALALRNDGTVWAWGDNHHGQLGDGTETDRPAPVQVPGLTGVTALAVGSGTIVGYGSSLALRNDGAVWAWGFNYHGQLGDGTKTDRSSPVQVPGLTGVTALAVGSSYSLARRSDGTVWAWGDNQYGQLGDGTTTQRLAPVQVSGLTDATAIDVGPSYSLARRSNGTVWAWGYNHDGRLGHRPTTSRSIPARVSSLTSVISLATGQKHSLALRSDSTVWAWGDNQEGALGNGTNTDLFTPTQVPGLIHIISLAASGAHSFALCEDGTVWAWGDNTYGQLGNGTETNQPLPVKVSNLTRVMSLATGGSSRSRSHSLALRTDGTVWAWGSNYDGQLGDGTTTGRSTPAQVSGLYGINAIAAGEAYSLALHGDGTVWAWGDNYDGQLGDGTTTNRLTPMKVPGLTSVTAIAVGQRHSLALRSDGTVWAWGNNTYRQLGHEAGMSHHSPVQVPGLTDVTSIAASAYHSLALRNDGTVWAWGDNSSGALGEGTTTDSHTPVKVSVLTNVTSIAATDSNSSLALRIDGTVWAWGSNYSGQLGDGTAAYSPVPVQALGP
jgi:alpha-tubulin suppressor-like RCC1 family protein